MNYQRMIMEVESPEQVGYDQVRVNLAESSMRDRSLVDLGMDPALLGDLLLQYGDHRGTEALRSLIAADGDGGLSPDDVLVTVGAAGALFLTATALFGPGDAIVVAQPNYASNLETPRAIGARIVPLDLRFRDNFRVDLNLLESLLTPEIRLVSLTSPHNPTGAVILPPDLTEIVRMVERAGAWLLLDETYRELGDHVAPPASVLSERVISVSSLSKTYGVPGIRVGWVTCRDRELMTTLLAAQEQAALAHSVLDMAVAEWVLSNRECFLPEIRSHVTSQRQIVADWVAGDDRAEWVAPTGGVVCFPRFTDTEIDAQAIYRNLQAEGIFLGPGWWFEQAPRHMRIGYGYPTADELRIGLAAISAELDRLG
jgi:aspartate/methionine/tyrosine aminotransferase